MCAISCSVSMNSIDDGNHIDLLQQIEINVDLTSRGVKYEHTVREHFSQPNLLTTQYCNESSRDLIVLAAAIPPLPRAA